MDRRNFAKGLFALPFMGKTLVAKETEEVEIKKDKSKTEDKQDTGQTFHCCCCDEKEKFPIHLIRVPSLGGTGYIFYQQKIEQRFSHLYSTGIIDSSVKIHYTRIEGT